VTAANPIGMLLRQRLPFLSLLALAACGIALAEHADAKSNFWLTVAVSAAATFFATGRRVAFGVFMGCTFATLHLWGSTESQAAQFAAWLGARSLPCEARGIVAAEPRVLSAERSSLEIRLSQLRVDSAELSPSFLLQLNCAAR
jgi:hypothetical protein